MACIDVALATWNGEAWLDAQLASLLTQTYPLRVVAGDDGSMDRTSAILRTWADRYPDRLIVLPPSLTRIGVVGNFARVLAACSAEWVACCDQDDIWDPDHVEILYRAGVNGAVDGPCLVAGDLRVVNATGEVIHASFRRMQAFNACLGADLRTAAVMNIFPGCAMLVNRRLLDLAMPLPLEAVMHDWWLVLCAAALGRIITIDRCVGDYRVHGGNTLGAERFSLLGRMRGWLAGTSSPAAGVRQAGRQAAALIRRHGKRIPVDRQSTLAAAAALVEGGWLERRQALLRGGLHRHPWPRQLNLWLNG